MIPVSEIRRPLLILGVGNYLMGDEGVGVQVAQSLAQDPMPPGVEVLDGGTGGFQLMGLLEPFRQIILIDATLDGRPAGTIRVLKPRFAAEFPRSMSTHDVGLRDVLEALEVTGRLPETQLIAVSVAGLQPMTIALTPPVQRAAGRVTAGLRQILQALVPPVASTELVG